MPDGVVDRPAEVWEPLIAVADAAGGDWPRRGRAACVALVKVAADRKVTLGIGLLTDLRTVFGDADTLPTSTILDRLCDRVRRSDEEPYLDADALWADLHGKPLAERGLATLLKKYDIHSTKVKVAGRALQGYRREPLHDAWQRYLPPLSPIEAEPVEPEEHLRPEVLEVPEVPLAMGRVRDEAEDLPF